MVFQSLWIALVGAGIAAGIYWLIRWAPWRGPRPRHPVLLAHGLMGFNTVGVGPLRREYFNGVAEHLKSLGIIVITPRVPALGSIEKRAEKLAAAIREAPAKRVNVVAHSMGGLDARHAISKLGVAGKVASLTTIGTPHRGAHAADLGKLGIATVLSRLGIGAFRDLTSTAMDTFNHEVKNVRGVRYGCVLSSVPDEGKVLNPLLIPVHRLTRRWAGANDGMVSERSQKWGRVLMRIEADHWGEIGWSKHFDAPQFYARLARKLRARGC